MYIEPEDQTIVAPYVNWTAQVQPSSGTAIPLSHPADILTKIRERERGQDAVLQLAGANDVPAPL
jgi:hypothetical protein